MAWVACMAILVNRSYLQASPARLATDLARYGSTAAWRGVYYRGEKIGFTVSQTIRTGRGLRAAGGRPAADDAARRDDRGRRSAPRRASTRLRPAVVRVLARSRHRRRSRCAGTIGLRARPGAPHSLTLAVTSAGTTRTEERELAEAPVLSQNLSRVLASGGLVPGTRHQWTIFDPATLRNAPVDARGRPARGRARRGRQRRARVPRRHGVPGLRTTSWVTDTGESCARRARWG